MNDTSIIRVQHNADNPFFMMSRATAQGALSFAALGVLTYLLSKPSDWQVQPSDIQERGGIGKDAVKTILSELEAAGYITVERNQKYTTGFNAPNRYTVYEIPQAGEPTVDNPPVENPPLTYTDREHKRELNPSRPASSSTTGSRSRSYMNVKVSKGGETPEGLADKNKINLERVQTSALVKAAMTIYSVDKITLDAKTVELLNTGRRIKTFGEPDRMYPSPIRMYDEIEAYSKFCVQRFQSLKMIGTSLPNALKNVCKLDIDPNEEVYKGKMPGFIAWMKTNRIDVENKIEEINYAAPD